MIKTAVENTFGRVRDAVGCRELSADLRLASGQCQVWGLDSNALVDPETNEGVFKDFIPRQSQISAFAPAIGDGDEFVWRR